MSSRNRGAEGERTVPRAVIHKKILDAASSRPDASLEELTTAVNGASETLVERVLDEYGDPAAGSQDDPQTEHDQDDEQTEHEGDGDRSDMSEQKSNGARSPATDRATRAVESESAELTGKQLEALQLIRVNPDATQRDLAERLDVTPSTVNDRLNSIEGFDWEHRQAFVESVLDGDSEPRDDVPPNAAAIGELTDRVSDLDERVASLAEGLDGQSAPESPFSDPDLVCKIVRACIQADHITEDEADRILKAVIASGTPPE